MRLAALCAAYLLSLAACNLQTDPLMATLPPTLPTNPSAFSPSPTPAPLTLGAELRTLVPPEGEAFQLLALYFDPARYSFRAHYTPNEAYTLRQWRERLPGAVGLINANFFTSEHLILGFLVSDGQVYGEPYTDRGGWFGVQNGQAFVRHSIHEPYRGEPLEQAVQAFPMLIWQGQPTQTDSRAVRPSRRTIIGQDGQGRIVWMVTPALGLGFYPLSHWLASSGAGLIHAFNLDGGGSTMLWFEPLDLHLPSFDPVPSVLAVYPR
ncbi:MAG: phosphodiester glycosidase family protein [Anaerolineae bacterium]|nr:phosphodiester glycosidase family protein [Anaerolineae bacterium]MDW8173463.1 phosphodiester glycosidase family protein [Anaerolineae bacterium]